MSKVFRDEIWVDDQIYNKTKKIQGFKNRIINGSFQVWQRGENYSYDTGILGYFTADRILSKNASDGQFTISKSSINGMNSIKFKVDTAVSDLTNDKYWRGLGYTFEGQHLYDLVIRGKNITISFWFNSNVTGKYSLCMRNITGNKTSESYVTEFEYLAANTPQKIIITIPLNHNFSTQPVNDENIGFDLIIGFLNQGDYSTSDINQWISGNYLTTPNCVNWGAEADNFFEIAQLQLEEGDVATDFEVVPYDVELMRCMRYYEKFTIVGLYSGSNNTDATYSYKNVKRIEPAITIYSTKDFEKGAIYYYSNSSDDRKNLTDGILINSSRHPNLDKKQFLWITETGYTPNETDDASFSCIVEADAEL